MIFAKDLPLLKIRLRSDFILPEVPLKYKIIRYAVEDILDQEFINEMFSIGLDLREVQLFIAPPNVIGTIHIDGHQKDLNAAAVNLVINENNDWVMQWFNTKETLDNKHVSSGDTTYMSFNIEQSQLIYEFTTKGAFLVQVGIAHRIVNKSNKSRYCLSLRFKDNNFENVLTNASRYCTEI